MKKLILAALMLVLITSVAWAKEITLSANPSGSSAAVSVLPKGEDNAGMIIIWDDGIMDDSWQDIYSRAMQFTAPMDCHVTRGMVYIYDEVMAYSPYYFAIYDDNEGLPGDELGGVIAMGGQTGGWNSTNVIPAGVILSEGDVFYGVVVKQNTGHPYLGYDTTAPIHGCFNNDGTEWIADDTANMMLRLVVDDDVEGPFTLNPNPAPDDTGVTGDTTVTFELHDSGYEVVPDSLVVVIDDTDVSQLCSVTALIDGGFIVSYKPEKGFDLGDVYVYWYAEDRLGNGAEDTWHFTVDVNADGTNTEESSWGVIKDTF